MLAVLLVPGQSSILLVLRYARHLLGDHIRCRAVALRDSLKMVSSTQITPRAIRPSQQPTVSLLEFITLSHFLRLHCGHERGPLHKLACGAIGCKK